MKYMLLLLLLTSCNDLNLRACSRMCPFGAKSYSSEQGCVCQTLEELCRSREPK